jgi:hypothetical protein
MDLNAQKEQFSIAYVRALAAVAGLKIRREEVDDDSVDIQFARSGGRSPYLDMQLKCSAAVERGENYFPFRLKLKNYEDLLRPRMVPCILGVLHVPERVEEWLEEGSDHVLVRHRAYWLNLRGFPSIAVAGDDAQEKKTTIHVPISNVLTPARLATMMDNIEMTGAL